MEDVMSSTDEEISKTLGLKNQPEGKSKKLWYILIVVLVFAAAFILYYYFLIKETPVQYLTKEAEQGTLTMTVSATGNLEPLNKVDVGTEVSGTIEKVYVDYNDPVKIGEKLAELDTMKLELKVKSAKASLLSAKANLASAKATLNDTKKTRDRYQKLYKSTKGRMPAQKDLDASQAAYALALAGKEGALAQIEQAKAVLESDEDNLKKAIITSPINGIVLVKNIEAGQTVAASLQTPVLFKLAEDLTRMKVIVSVDEADVGQVREEQNATFSVDAYPEHIFNGEIIQVRLNSQIVNGVVTYEAVMHVDNSDLLLRPGMTATADIITKVIKDALLVPNAALRFTPPAKLKEDEKESQKLIDKLIPAPPVKESKAKITDDKKRATVWILKEGKAVSVSVKTGDSDGIFTVIKSDHIKPGAEVIIDTKVP